MKIPDIDFFDIRMHRGNQSNAFEELCCQIAGDEDLGTTRVSFDRKGPGGDGGVECFATLSDGSEVGWQVKHYTDLGNALKSLDESLNTALSKHPKMKRFIACLPFDLSDSRKEHPKKKGATVQTALARWDAWKRERIEESNKIGRTIEIDRWGAFELKNRLTKSGAIAAGRVAFWFDKTLLTTNWLREKFERTRSSLGGRYSPHHHIDLPIRRVIEATALDPRLFEYLAYSSTKILRELQAAAPADPTADTACTRTAEAFKNAAEDPSRSVPLAALRQAIEDARGAVLPWYSVQRDAVAPNHTNPQANRISTLLSSLNSLARELAQPYWNYVDIRALLVIGAAGSGKSHLFADICDHAIQSDRPAIMVLGNKLPDAEPWGEIMRDLGLPQDLQVETFLGALNAAGQAAGVRTLLMIDALNEKYGQAIWPERLAGLVHDVSKFEWISLVLSCRSSYESLIIPEELNEQKLPRIEHDGFSAQEARLYIEKRGIRLAEEPNPVEELSIPLFLSLCCDALLSQEKQVLANSLGGVTAVFKLFTDAVEKKIARQLGSSTDRRYVKQSIDVLAREMADTDREWIPMSRAQALIETFFRPPTVSANHDLLFQLHNEGLLALEPAETDDTERECGFMFQRLSDHAIASSLLDRSVSGNDLSFAFNGDTPLSKVIASGIPSIGPGLLEALAIQVPERFGVELHDIEHPFEQWSADDAFEESLLTRSAKAFTDRTWALIDEIGGESLRFETLIALSTDPARDHNAEHLDGELRSQPLPIRDATWSVHLAQSDAQRSGRLIEWVREAVQAAISHERAALTGLQLCWFFTTSNRTVRDNATKALVALLAGRSNLAISLWERFRNLDDAYVTERLVAAIYGACMQGVWTADELVSIARILHKDVHTIDALSRNILTRDHVSGVIGYVRSRTKLTIDSDRSSVSQSFESPWPLEYVTESELESYTRDYSGGARHRDEIASSSVFDGDFARYQIDHAVRDWSASTKRENQLLTAQQLADRWFESIRETASPAMLAAHETLQGVLRTVDPRAPWQSRDVVDQAKAQFRQAVGEETYAQWSAHASAWQQSGMFQSFSLRADQAAPFNLAWARRWVCKRAHELGWSESLHGEFDSSVRNERHSHDIERIGKKYQWIALYELCARMADNLQPLPGRNDPGDTRRLRNIDPSLLLTKTTDDGWRRFEQQGFWSPPAPELNPVTLDEALIWLNANQDIYDDPSNIEVTNPTDGGKWLVLQSFESWNGRADALERDTWRRIGCFIVRKKDLKRALALVKSVHFQGNDDVPSALSSGFRSYLGEHPWLWRMEGNDPDARAGADEWIENWRPRESAGRAISIRPTTAPYLAEASSYDASISQNINLILPAGWLIDSLGLRLTDGQTIRYVDDAQMVRFMDPSVGIDGRSAALVDRRAFLDYLSQENLVAVWPLAGEKSVYGASGKGGFGGRWTFTRIFYSKGNDIVPLDRYESFEAPSANQLAALRSP